VASFDRIVVIFNPQSTGEAPRLAEELRADLARRLPSTAVTTEVLALDAGTKVQVDIAPGALATVG
jgi:hypothetical protein